MPSIGDIASLLGLKDPYATYKFWVEVNGIMGAYFSECSGLEMSMDVLEQPEGGLNDYVHKFPGRTKWSNVTLKRGFTANNELFNWYMQTMTALNTGAGVPRFPVTIKLYSVNQSLDLFSQVKYFNLLNAFPVKWVGPTFKVDEAAVAVETLEFAHDGIKIG